MADKTQINLERIRACDAEWNESDHPRSENGQFTSGAGAHVSKIQSGGKAKVQQLKNVSGALAGVNAGIEKAQKTFSAQMDRTRKAGAAKHKDLEQREDAVRKKYEGDWRYGHMYGKLKNKPGYEGLAERVKNKAKSREAQKRDELAGLEKEYHQIQNEYDPIVGERQRAANKQYGQSMSQLWPQKQALEAQQKKFQGAKKTLEKARPGIAKMREQAKAAAPARKMDDLTKKSMQQGKNDHAMVTMMLKSEMAMADGDFHKAVGALQRKFDDPGFMMDESRQKELSDILLNDVSGDAFDVIDPENVRSGSAAKKADANKAAKEQIFKQAAAASKKTAEAKAAKEAAVAKKTLSDIDSRIAEAKRKGDIKSVSFLEAAKASAQKKASKSKPTTRFDKDMAKADKSYEDFREVMQKRKSEIDVLNERLRTTKNSFVAKATKQELDRLVSEYNQLDEMY